MPDLDFLEHLNTEVRAALNTTTPSIFSMSCWATRGQPRRSFEQRTDLGSHDGLSSSFLAQREKGEARGAMEGYVCICCQPALPRSNPSYVFQMHTLGTYQPTKVRLQELNTDMYDAVTHYVCVCVCAGRESKSNGRPAIPPTAREAPIESEFACSSSADHPTWDGMACECNTGRRSRIITRTQGIMCLN